ncbi:hypothetical protein [Paenibacillus xylanexedens]|uniref:hypothetical protein n=1 Tax=Paenibacillus xylanexedens TaxID=528191 RepID=UPI0011A761F8|nr:hypothetical protein [Paenibacillus xylanexedens]
MKKTKSSGEYGERLKQILSYCESKEDLMHTRLSVIINELWDIPSVSKDLLSEIEELYIQKGELYCSLAYDKGYEDGYEDHCKSC